MVTTPRAATAFRVGVQRFIAQRRRRGVVRDFHLLYYYGNTWKNTRWMGRTVLKCPLDLWQYQQIVVEQRPDVIVETGTADGGSALFLAHICDLVGHGRVVSVDISHTLEELPQHDRITYITGSSTDDVVLQRVAEEVGASASVMVSLDSDHSAEHVRRELDEYQRFVTPGAYLIVEDSNVNGHPVGPLFGPGPMEALLEFLEVSENFEIDTAREQYLMTQNPQGYLRRIK